MTIIQFTKKDQFVHALGARRREMAAHDKKVTAAHRKAEQEWLTEFRRLCREAAKWDYARASNTGYRRGDDDAANPLYEHMSRNRVSCPRLMEPRLDALLRSLMLTRQETFRIEKGGAWGEAYDLLTWQSEPAKTTPC